MPADRLRSSFYQAVGRFPILAGHLRRRGRNGMCVVVDCDDLNLPLYEERVHPTLHFRHLRENHFHRTAWPPGANVSDPRIGLEAHASPKLAHVQVHRLAENSGVVLVVRIAHSVVDAKGFVEFVRCWAGLCCDPMNPDSLSPLLTDRNVMYEHLPAAVRPRSRSAWDPLAWLTLGLSLLISLLLRFYDRFLREQSAPDDIESHLFHVPRPVLDRVREAASSLQPLGPRVSDNDIVIALFTLAFAHSTQQVALEDASATTNPSLFRRLRPRRQSPVSAIVPCDFRHRIGVPQNYTGSCAIGLYVTTPPDLLQAGTISTEAIARVALISRDVVDHVNRTTIEGFITRALRVIRLVGTQANVLYSLMVCQAFSNQSRLGFYDVDFGDGPPVFVAPMAYSNTVAVIMASPPSSLAGDVPVFLTLRPRLMQALLKKEILGNLATLVY
ncbi:acyltransferase helD2 [Aspergillus lucknowensis]|uniref:Transferase family protein n=1 Tax=Aspergillus lucknowensis TaxID=176173 RepID=A0ABR4LHR2_9EURO